MIFVSLFKFRKKPTREGSKKFENTAAPLMKKLGIKVLSNYGTLGRYDAVAVHEAPNAKSIMEFLVAVSEDMKSETLVAVEDYEDLLK